MALEIGIDRALLSLAAGELVPRLSAGNVSPWRVGDGLGLGLGMGRVGETLRLVAGTRSVGETLGLGCGAGRVGDGLRLGLGTGSVGETVGLVVGTRSVGDTRGLGWGTTSVGETLGLIFGMGSDEDLSLLALSELRHVREGEEGGSMVFIDIKDTGDGEA